MAEFTLFKQLTMEYEKSLRDKNIEKDNNNCKHKNLIDEKGICVCIDCGEEIEKTEDKDWKEYAPSDVKHVSDPNRVQMRKIEERSIYKDVETLGFSENIVSHANRTYAEVTQGKIFRGNSRKAIIFACIFHAYKSCKTPQSHETLLRVFNLDHKSGLKGLKHVRLHAKNTSIKTTYIEPLDLIDEIMEKFSVTAEQKKEVRDICVKIRKKSSRLIRSRPQCVSASVVYYWICLTKKGINLKDFSKKVGLSELTISRLAKEIAEVLKTPGII